MSDLKNQVESLLFSAGKRLTVEELAGLCKEENLDAVRAALEILRKELDEKQSSLMLVEEGNGWKLTVREKYIQVVKKVVKTPELPKSLLETLAVVAYKAPVLQSQVIKIRTNKAYRHLDELEEMGYLTREKKGRSKLIKLTQKFFDYFDVPPEKLKEKFKNVAALEQAIEEKESAIQVAQGSIVDAAVATAPGVEIVHDAPPKLAPEIEILDEKLGDLETYGEAPKHKKKHKKKKEAEAETPKTPEEAAEALAERIISEAGMAAPEATEEETSAMEEEGRLTVEKIKREASHEKPKKTSYVPKGMFAEGVPEEVKERIEHRVQELLSGEQAAEPTSEETAEIPDVIPAPAEQPEEKETAEEAPAEEPAEPQAEEQAPAEEKPANETPAEEPVIEAIEQEIPPEKPKKRKKKPKAEETAPEEAPEGQ
jgi:segregation and condensation protein B